MLNSLNNPDVIRIIGDNVVNRVSKHLVYVSQLQKVFNNHRVTLLQILKVKFEYHSLHFIGYIRGSVCDSFFVICLWGPEAVTIELERILAYDLAYTSDRLEHMCLYYTCVPKTSLWSFNRHVSRLRHTILNYVSVYARTLCQ